MEQLVIACGRSGVSMSKSDGLTGHFWLDRVIEPKAKPLPVLSGLMSREPTALSMPFSQKPDGRLSPQTASIVQTVHCAASNRTPCYLCVLHELPVFSCTAVAASHIATSRLTARP